MLSNGVGAASSLFGRPGGGYFLAHYCCVRLAIHIVLVIDTVQRYELSLKNVSLKPKKINYDSDLILPKCRNVEMSLRIFGGCENVVKENIIDFCLYYNIIIL